MSYTFTIADAGYHQEPMILDDGEVVLEEDGVTVVMETICDEPEMALSVSNAYAVFDTLGLPHPKDGCGTFEVSFLPELRRRIISAKNGDLPERELKVTGIMVTLPLPSEALLSRLEYLERIAIRAQELGRPINFY